METITQKSINALTYEIIGAGIEVHKLLGPGLLENIYEKAMVYELQLRGLVVEQQKRVDIQYKGLALDCPLRFDLLINKQIVVELKACAYMIPVYDAQLLNYMSCLQVPKGILMNFFCP